MRLRPSIQLSRSRFKEAWLNLDLEVHYRDPRALIAYPRNPRTHSPRQIQQIEASVGEFGFLVPILINSKDGIIAGRARAIAAINLGISEIPTICVDHLTPAQVRAFIIADNRIAENAGWDRELLALELQEIAAAAEFDISITGFELPEIDVLFEELTEPGSAKADDVPEVDRTKPAVSQEGDIWEIGNGHFLACGNSLVAATFRGLLGTNKAQMVFADPPYNVKIGGHASGMGKAEHREFPMASGEMDQSQFTNFLSMTFRHLKAFSIDGSIHFVCMDWRHMREMLDAGKEYSELKNLCVWAKTNAGMGSLYRLRRRNRAQ